MCHLLPNYSRVVSKYFPKWCHYAQHCCPASCRIESSSSSNWLQVTVMLLWKTLGWQVKKIPGYLVVALFTGTLGHQTCPLSHPIWVVESSSRSLTFRAADFTPKCSKFHPKPGPYVGGTRSLCAPSANVVHCNKFNTAGACRLCLNSLGAARDLHCLHPRTAWYSSRLPWFTSSSFSAG